MSSLYKVPLVLSAQPEGGYTITSPVLPELVTEGDTVEEAIANVDDALTAVLELYDDLGRPVPSNLRQDPGDACKTSLRPLCALCVSAVRSDVAPQINRRWR